MKHNKESRLYEADEGKMFVRTTDNKIMGDGICLGDNDDISNYEEREFTEEQRVQFFEELGMEDPKKRKEKIHKYKSKLDKN